MLEMYVPEEPADRECRHAPEDGCMYCCSKCNYDMHYCQGCGKSTPHRQQDVCLKCQNRTR